MAGLVIAFQKFIPSKGMFEIRMDWVDNFAYVFSPAGNRQC